MSRGKTARSVEHEWVDSSKRFDGKKTCMRDKLQSTAARIPYESDAFMIRFTRI